jgi:hypothetical protein
VVNYSTSFRTPDHVREEWAALGARQFVTEEYDRSMDAVEARLGVNSDHDKAAPRDAILERGARELGWNVAAMPRNVRGCDQDVECGRCGMGCRIGAKQSVAKTWLQDAQAAGARLRLPRHVGGRPRRPGVGPARPLRGRRLVLPDRVRGQPDDLDRVDRAHDGDPPRGAAVGLTRKRRRPRRSGVVAVLDRVRSRGRSPPAGPWGRG